MLTEEIDLTFCGGEGDEPCKKKQKTVVDYSEIEDLARRMKNLFGGFGSGKYGSSTEDIEDLVRRMKNLNPKFTIPCMLVEKNQSEKEPECQQATLLAHLMRDLVVKGFTESNYSTNEEGVLAGETEGREEKGFYVGVEDDKAAVEAYFQTDIQDDGLTDIWEEMTIALEHSKDITEDSSSGKHASESGVNCVHSFILEDDVGCVCCICGVIERGIETVVDYPYPKAEISAHPRHEKHMKPHQVEGFNFLTSNLVADNPGGCILACAQGSGITFIILSFVQSFLVKYPNARPLLVVPNGFLLTWKREFQKWQVEDIPLFDFYTAKADNQSQQLGVLKQWIEQKSILFLGYKQFSSIIHGSATCTIAASCQKILLEAPSILILDEGHTPRNENTDLLDSLAKVQTPLKVVLSGALYQNHMKEVFNILNLVCPNFLRLDTTRDIKKRIMRRLRISGARKQVKSTFINLVEHTLLIDEDFRRKINVIQDLREMTSKVLHYCKAGRLDELPGLEDFTVLLNLSAKQKSEVEMVKKLETKFKRNFVGSALYVHPHLRDLLVDVTTDKGMLSFVNDEKVDEILKSFDIREGAKAKFFLNFLSLCESVGEKLVVFSQYFPLLKFLETLAKKIKGWSSGKETFMISGDSSWEHREWSMEQFNSSSDAKVFFGLIKACGEGISLVGASRILILDVHLNPYVTLQGIRCAFRRGQKKKVYTYRLVAADSPEEEDNITCFRKELILKLWFEWNEVCGHQGFEMKTVDMNETGDPFLQSSLLQDDIKVLHRR